MTKKSTYQSLNSGHSIERNKVPTEIIYHRASRKLELIYPNNHSVEMSSEYLRVLSPSAEVRGHSPDQATLQYGKKNVTIANIIHQGSYAIRISFDDGHDTGVYTWHYLWNLAHHQHDYWNEYLQAILVAGKSR